MFTMGKALVIKNADFATNKVATVTLLTPCTNIEFNQSSVTVNSMRTTSIGYTVTPSDAGDIISITSSNASIISTNGTTLTINGIGTCTLTISCGGFTDTCTVTVDIYEDPIYLIGEIGILTPASTGEEHDAFFGKGNTDFAFTCYGHFSDNRFQYPVRYTLSNHGFDIDEQITAIKIPNNANKIHVESVGGLYNGSAQVKMYFVDANQQYTYSSNTLIPILSTSSVDVTGNKVNADITVPSGRTGYVLTCNTRNSLPGNKTDFDAYVTDTIGLSIHYLHTS